LSSISLPNQVSDDNHGCVIISKADFDRNILMQRPTLPSDEFGSVIHIHHCTPSSLSS
jgi:hypothetical protein